MNDLDKLKKRELIQIVEEFEEENDILKNHINSFGVAMIVFDDKKRTAIVSRIINGLMDGQFEEYEIKLIESMLEFAYTRGWNDYQEALLKEKELLRKEVMP